MTKTEDMTRQEAADTLGLSMRQVHRLVRAGTIRVTWERRDGGRVRVLYNRADVEAEAGRRQAPEADHAE